MDEEAPRDPLHRSTIVLEGSGHLDGVLEILDVRLEADPVRWKVLTPDLIQIEGGVRAYLYTRNAKGKDVEGQGIHIPFSTRAPAADLPTDRIDVAIDELRSGYDHDPVTGAFRHRITVEILVRCASSEDGDITASDAKTLAQEAPDTDAPDVPRTNSETSDARADTDTTETIVWRPFPPPIA